MSQMVHIEVPDELSATLDREPSQLGAELRLAAAVKWYEVGVLSQGKAAEVAGLSRAEFIDALGRFSVSPFQETPDEVIQSLRENKR